MRIFSAIRHSSDPKYFSSALWSSNFYPALHQLGHEVIESQVDLLPTSRFMEIADQFTPQELEVRARTTDQILDEVRKAHQLRPVDLFLSYFYHSHFDPATFSDIRRLGIPSVNFYCNSIYQFRQVAAIASQVDFSWHAERDARQLYLAAEANPIWVQMGADPTLYHPERDAVRTPKACFVGQRYADRDSWVAALIEAKVPVEVFGQGWGADFSSDSEGTAQTGTAAPYLGRARPVPGSRASYLAAVRLAVERDGYWRGAQRIARQFHLRRKAIQSKPLFAPIARGRAGDVSETFANFELILNFSNVWSDGRPGSSLISHVRLRDFEAPMCRSCYLTGHSSEIEEFYDVGREIDTYRTLEEFVDKARYYLSHPLVAESLREAGYQRALRDHTWVRRFEELFAKIGVSPRTAF